MLIPLLLGAVAVATAEEPTFRATQYGQLDLFLPQSTLHLESILGSMALWEEVSSYHPKDRIRELARPVGRLDLQLSKGGMSTCTASVLPGGYLLTNNHCIPGDGHYGVVQRAQLVMGYLSAGDQTGTEVFEVETVAVEHNPALDYAIVRFKGPSPEPRWGTITIDPRMPGPAESLMIVHHPMGKPQMVTRARCRTASPNPVVGVDIRHKCDTIGGSSGSPVFSDAAGTVIGLHFAGNVGSPADQYNAAKAIRAIWDGSDLLRSLYVSRPTPGASVPTAPTVAPVTSPAPRDVVAAVRAVPAGGTTVWDKSVAGLLLGAFDADRSGKIDQPGEVRAVGCDAWKAVDDGVRAGHGDSLFKVYGFFPTGIFFGSMLGIDASRKTDVAAALSACGLASGGAALTDPISALQAAASLDAAGWDRAAGRALVASYDADKTGLIDASAEVQAVPCDAWAILDRGARTHVGGSLARAYGLAPGLIWMGDRLSLAKSAQDAIGKRLAACSLDAGAGGAPPPRSAAGSTDFASLVSSIPADRYWTEKVRPLVLSAADKDGSGDLSASEATAFDCRAWSVLDGAVRSMWDGQGLGTIYGIAPHRIWLGHMLGVNPAARDAAWARLQACGLAY